MVHELLHWLRTKNGTVVGDTHMHCHGIARCTTDKAYGEEDSAHLANYDGGDEGTKNAQKRRRVDHRKRALRNNDNYANFIYYLGRKAYTRSTDYALPVVDQFPTRDFTW